MSADARCGVANFMTGSRPKSSPASERNGEREQQDERIDRRSRRCGAGRPARWRRASGCRRTPGRGRRRRPTSARVRLSDSSSQAIRREPAPSAAWIASSCCRASARTRNRFATLAQAMSRTRPTVPSSTHSTRPTSPMTSAASGLTLGPIFDVVEHLAREAGRHREPIRDDRDQARDVGVGLLDRHAGLQPRDTAVAEVGRVQFRPVEAERAG